MKKRNEYNERGSYLSDDTWSILETRISRLKNTDAKNNHRNEIIAFTDAVKKDFLDITRDDVERYLNNLIRAGRTPETVKVKMSILKGMAKECDRTKSSDMTRNVFGGLAIGRDKESYSTDDLACLEEVDKVLGYCKEKGERQLMLIIALALEAALPSRDIIGLKVNNIHLNKLDQPYIKFGDEYENYKGQTRHFIREIPLKQETAEELNRLIMSRENVREGDNVFQDRWGNALSARLLQKMMRDANCKVCVPDDKKFTISKLNNLAVVAMRQGGAKDAELSDQLGHVSSWINRYDSVTKDFSMTPIMMNNISVLY